MDELTCMKLVRVDDGEDNQGRKLFHHERCGKPASEVEIGGMLTKAKAILCAQHKRKADRGSFTSQKGYPYGRVRKSEKEAGYLQPRLEGTGLINK